MTTTSRNLLFFFVFLLSLLPACGSDDSSPVSSGDTDAQTEAEAEENVPTCTLDNSLAPPPHPTDVLGYEPVTREAEGTPPTEEEVTAFTKKITAFFKDTGYFDWVWRTSHGLDASYNTEHGTEMMPYKLWWQDVGMRKDGDAIVFFHRGRAENICKRTIKVLSNALAGYLLTGDERMGEVAEQLMRGMVALSLGLEFEKEDPLVKYLQARAVFNHNHEYTVDGRKVSIDYKGMYTPSFKWNVHVFEIPDNPTYGDIWVSNMRSKDDVPYMYLSLPIATRAFYEAEDESLREAAKLYIEYMRGHSQSIVDNDWYILTKYEDGEAVIAYDATKKDNPPADLGSYRHWEAVFGPDAECNAQLGAALSGYGYPADRGHCPGNHAGWDFELLAVGSNYFNYNIYNYFHLAAMANAQLWGCNDISRKISEDMVFRFDEIRHNPTMPNTDDREFDSDLAGVLLASATHGYPLTADEARHIMDWYGKSSDYYRQWEHWDPWNSLEDGEEFTDYKAPRVGKGDDGEGGEKDISYVRLVEMPYIFEYCYSPINSAQTMRFIDCDIVADPSKWGE